MDSPGTIKLLIESLWSTDKAAFSGILDHFEQQIEAYEKSFKLAIQANIVGGDNKTAAAILTVAVAGSDKTRSEQAYIFGVKESQITTSVR